MKLLPSIITGAAALALATVAVAEEPMTLTDAQMDRVSAGFASASVSAGSDCYRCYASSYGGFDLHTDDRRRYRSAGASIWQNTTVYRGSVDTYTSANAFVGR